MIGSAFKKFAQEKGLSVSSGVAYGKLYDYAVTLFDGSGTKNLVITTRFADAEKKQELMNELEQHNLMKEFQIQNISFAYDAIMVIFHDNPGTMKKFNAFIEYFFPLLPMYDASPANVCTQCGMELGGDNWKLVNGIAYNLHSACAEKLAAEAEDEAAAEKEEKKGSYFMGLVGALLGGIIGAIPWALLLLLGYMASIVGVVIGWLAERGYRLLGGKNGKGKIAILAIAAIVGVVVGTFAADWIILSRMISGGELPGFTMGDIPVLIISLLVADAEYLRVTLGNIGLGLLFAFLGEWFFLKRAYKETKGFSMKNLD